jgi:hypothetical protein
MSANYTGFNPDQILNGLHSRYFYALRRTEEGELFLSKVDQLKKGDSVEINKPGDPSGNFPFFQEGQNFYEGRDVYHNLIYANLNYEQWEWEGRNLLYYVNDDGDLVVKIDEHHSFDDTVSSDGIE